MAGEVDPLAVVAASRQPAEPWFAFEQPEREGFALAAIGQVREVTGPRAERFEAMSGAWRSLLAEAHADPPGAVPGSGLVALGGLAFSPDGCASQTWEGFAPSSLTIPELALARRGAQTWLTVNVSVAPDDTVEQATARVHRRLDALRSAALPLLDPAPVGTYRVRSVMPPSHYEEAVARTRARIRDGELEKLVLAREVEVTAPSEHDPAAILALLREGFQAASCSRWGAAWLRSSRPARNC